MQKTLRLDARNPADLERAAALLRAGETVAFPTETVYGLGADALDVAAVGAIFAAKQRPSWDPVIVHLAQSAQLGEVTDVPQELVARVNALAEAFWPGPLTLLLPKSAAVPDLVTAGRPLVGVRVPAHPVALELIRRAARPIAAPSANSFGHTSPTTAAHVLADLDGRIAAVLDGGATTVGVESTVLDPAAMIVYRAGAVTLEQIAAVTGRPAKLYVAPAQRAEPSSLPAPGVGIRHYAPRAEVVLVDGSEAALAKSAMEERRWTAGVLLPKGWSLPDTEALVIFDWGEWERPETLATTLFAGLRALDDAGVKRILCPLPPAGGMGDALRDRLMKAARPR